MIKIKLRKCGVYISAVLTVESTTVDLGMLNESELKALTNDVQDILEELQSYDC